MARTIFNRIVFRFAAYVKEHLGFLLIAVSILFLIGAAVSQSIGAVWPNINNNPLYLSDTLGILAYVTLGVGVIAQIVCFTKDQIIEAVRRVAGFLKRESMEETSK